MGLIINCILMMISAVVFVLGISFFVRNSGTNDKIRYYILFLTFFSAVWCAAYGAIGVTDKMHVAEILRVLGVFSINAFLVVEVFLFTGLSRMNIGISHSLRFFVIAIGAADFVMYSGRKVDTFIRVGNWTTWVTNPDYSFARSFHGGFVFFYFIILLGSGIAWAIKNKLRRQRRFIILAFASNFLLIIFSIPDTFMPSLGYYPIPTSGLGSALCASVIWYAATRLNSFSIRMGTISRILYDFINAGAVVFDTDRRIEMANPYAVQSSGAESIEGCGIDALFKTEDIDGIFDRALQNKYNIRLDGKNDDRVYSVSLSAARDDFGDPYCFLCVFVDVTDEARAISELEIANNAKMEFLTSISHEIRTPINSIIGFNDMIIRDTDQNEIREYAGNSEHASRQLLAIVNDLLDMGQITSGKMKIAPDEYDLGVLLKDVADMQEPRADEKGLKFDMNVDETTPRNLIGDAVRIQQIITNLVTNAVKYTMEGSVRVGVGYERTADDSILLRVRVTDTGIGIREENIPHLYDTFSRFDKKNHKYIEGTGVGLSVTKSILDMMDGEIEVDSIYGKGSTFIVTIPQQVAGDAVVGSLKDYEGAKVDAARITYRAPQASVLVVDDNEMNRMVFRGMVRPLGMDLDEADGGARMLELIHSKKYDIIFLDHMMPGMDGIEALGRMKEDHSHPNVSTPVIVMTANAGRGAREMYIDSGFDDYVSKPTNAKELLKVIKKYLPDELVEYTDDDSGVSDDSPEEVPETSPYPDIDGVDWKAARSTAADQESLRIIMDKFCSMAPREAAELDSYYAGIIDGIGSAVTSYRIKVHSMKNSAALVGALQLSDVALGLEKAADTGDTEFIKAGHEAFCNEYTAMADRIRLALTGEATHTVKVMDRQELGESLSIMEKAMDELDMTTLNEKVYEMSDLGYEDPEIKEYMEKLFVSVRDYDTDSFESLISEIRARL